MKQDEEQYIIHGFKPLGPLTDISLGEHVFNSLLNNRKQEALINAITKQSVTYQDILDKTTRLAHSLRQCGYKKDDIFSICSENHLYFFYPIIAALYMGAIMAPVNPSYTQGEMTHSLNISKPKVMFCSKNCLGKVLEVKKRVGFIEKVIVIDLEKILNFPDVETMNGLIGKHTDRFFDPRYFIPTSVNIEQQVAFIMCSSGTTGLPKGVMTTHKNVHVRIAHLNDPRVTDIRPNDSIFGVIPFFHGFGFMTCLGAIIQGQKIVLLPRFEEHLFLKTIQDYRIQTLWLVPPLVVFLAKSPLVDQYDLSSIQEIASGAAPLSKETEELVKKRLKLKVIRQGYGLTEATLAVLMMPINDDRHGSSGKVVSYMKAKVCDPETGKILGPEKVGELWFKGDMIMKGYYGNMEATRHTIDQDGWLHTGDLGYYDKEGYFYIVDRLKELIKYKGFQVPPAELEALLLAHPKIKDAGVIGLPNEEAGELPFAFVVKAPGASLTEKEVQDFIASQVSPPKRLRGGVHFVTSIPKNPSGKILRRDLRAMLQKHKSKL